MVKVRLLNAENPYSSTFAAYPKLLQQEGIGGAFRGVVPSTLRGASLAVGELAAYDQIKHELKSTFGCNEGASVHFISSILTGVVATTMAAPFDLIKTRAMAGMSTTSSIQILITTIKHEGPLSLFRGWVPAYFRLGPHALICLPVLEQLRLFVGIGYL